MRNRSLFSSFVGSFCLLFSSAATLWAEENVPLVPPPTTDVALKSDDDFLSILEHVLSSGAMDKVLEQRWDIIQERKRSLRLAQQREKKRQAEANRMLAIRNNMPPPNTDNEPFLGKKDATFSLIEYSDFGCPYCKRFHDTGKKFVEKYGKHVNWIYRDMPLSIHEPYATELSVGGRCLYVLGGNKGFWDFADAAFSRPAEAKKGRTFVESFAAEYGISKEKLTNCMVSRDALSVVEKHVKDSSKSQFTGTPSVVLRNNLTGDIKFFPGAVPFNKLEHALANMAEKQTKQLGVSPSTDNK